MGTGGKENTTNAHHIKMRSLNFMSNQWMTMEEFNQARDTKMVDRWKEVMGGLEKEIHDRC